ncbi:MAG: DUF1330 domain-containing protein [Pseudomonadota bacterium]
MTVYIIAEVKIHDRSEYDRYDDGFMEVFEKYEGSLLSVDEAPTVLEGEAWGSTRSVLMSFPSAEAASAWAQSPEYQAIAKHRLAGSTMVRAMMVRAGTPALDEK